MSPFTGRSRSVQIWQDTHEQQRGAPSSPEPKARTVPIAGRFNPRAGQIAGILVPLPLMPFEAQVVQGLERYLRCLSDWDQRFFELPSRVGISTSWPGWIAFTASDLKHWPSLRASAQIALRSVCVGREHRRTSRPGQRLGNTLPGSVGTTPPLRPGPWDGAMGPPAPCIGAGGPSRSSLGRRSLRIPPC